jgi:hypothetical protein
MNAQKKMANGNGVAEELISDGCLTVEVRGSKRIAFFETLTRPGIREPRENRGRLRHCNGLQTPTATGSDSTRIGKAGARLSPKSGYRSGCARRGPGVRGQLLRQEKDEASRFRECGIGFAECLHSPFCRGLKVFYLCLQLRAGLSN